MTGLFGALGLRGGSVALREAPRDLRFDEEDGTSGSAFKDASSVFCFLDFDIWACLCCSDRVMSGGRVS